MQTYI